jgi:selenocysteine-specific elongation factor
MKHLIMGTAGHVDHGKTSLIKALTGMDCDTHKEEKRRGITINLGFSYLNLPNGESVGIIDVPGHKDFINTMVGGACGIDFVMLVIAADSGIMPQTIEHMNIIHSLGVKHGIVALTKADLVDEELAELAIMEIREFLEKTSLKDAAVVPVSSISGAGLDVLKMEIQQLITKMDEREHGSTFRLYIDRIFSVKGFGSVVTGSVLSGSLAVDQEVFLLPGDHPGLRVRSLERHGMAVDKVVGGDRAAINLIGLDLEDFKRGMLLAGKRMESTVMIDAAIKVFDPDAKLGLWSHVTFHTGTYESPGRMHSITQDQIRKDETVVVQIHLERPAVLVNKDRFIIRNSSGDRSLGGGFIIDSAPLHHKKRSSALVATLTQLAETLQKGDSLSELIKLELKKSARPFLLSAIAEKVHMKTEDLRLVISAGVSGFDAFDTEEGFFLFDQGFSHSAEEMLLKVLDDYHREFPVFADGMDANEIAGKLGFTKSKQDRAFVLSFLNSMVNRTLLERSKNTWIRRGHRAVVTEAAAQAIQWLEQIIRDYDVQKPVITEIEEQAAIQRITKHDLKMYISYLVKTGKVVYYQSDFLHSEVVKKYRPVLLHLLGDKNDGLEINAFKEKINASKKLIAVLVGIYETEKIVTTTGTGIDTKIFLTLNGKNLYASLSR